MEYKGEKCRQIGVFGLVWAVKGLFQSAVLLLRLNQRKPVNAAACLVLAVLMAFLLSGYPVGKGRRGLGIGGKQGDGGSSAPMRPIPRPPTRNSPYR